jgi:hypothetical protein
MQQDEEWQSNENSRVPDEVNRVVCVELLNGQTVKAQVKYFDWSTCANSPMRIVKWKYE